jgi:pimeloyl-ACP methyl ester carboxylesterase
MTWPVTSLLTFCLLLGCAEPRINPPTQPRLVAADELKRAAVSASGDLQTWVWGELRLAYQDTGGAALPVIVCLHAVGHGAGDYAALVARLRGNYRVIALDWPGQGRSGASTIEPGVDAYAKLLDAFLRDLRLQRVVLIGNSVGGGAALLYAARHPDQVSRVVVSNPAGLDEGGWLGRVFTWWMAQRFEWAAVDPVAFKEWFAGYYASVLPSAPAAAQRAHIVAAGEEVAPLLAAAWRGFSRPENDVRTQVKSLPMPVLVAWAQRDNVVRWSRNEVAVKTIPNHRVEFFDAGHTPVLEAPEHFLAVIEPFLAGGP